MFIGLNKTIDKFHPYKIKFCQESNDENADRSRQFWNNFTERFSNDLGLLYIICFSDESAFVLNSE